MQMYGHFVVRAMPYELPIFYRAIQRCKDVEVKPLTLCVPKNIRPNAKSMDSNIIFGESSHDLFDNSINASLNLRILDQCIAAIG